MGVTELLLIGSVVFLIAGSVKGVVGIGLPTAAISMLTLFIDPRTAIAVGLGPVVVSNAWQIWTMGDIRGTFKRYWLFALALGTSVFLTVTVSADVSEQVIFLAIGISIVTFSVLHLNFAMPPMPDRYDRAAQVGFGTVAGILGGLSGVWIAPIIMYLSARNLTKDEFVRASGMLLFIGSVPLVTAYVQQGFLTQQIAGVTLVLVIPTLIGFALGARLRQRISNEKFRKVLLYVFLLLGLNLLRRGLF
ncbi:sulfite exporter TauE/SafE family protein [Marivita sp.]|uniref:sulfite exporter TauE/SafE family protein n=1 Tax=Marivita sp. TaxID=2003365 RepID=UPI003F6CACAD